MSKCETTITTNAASLAIDPIAWKLSTASSCCTDCKKEEKMNNNEFLKIKKDQELSKIDKEYQLKREEILKQDPIQIRIHQLQKEINSMYEEEKSIRRADLSNIMHMTEDTREKIRELTYEQENKEDGIVAKYKEIEALVIDIPAKDRIEIYKMYNIM